MRLPVLLFGLAVLGTAALAQDPAAPRAPTNPSPDTGADLSYEGRLIGRIEFDPADQPLPRPELDRLLLVQSGQPLRMEALRESLQKLYATGRYTDVSIEALPESAAASAAVNLRVITTPAFFVGSVTLEGASDPPNRNQLLTAAKLELGAPFAAYDVQQAVENMHERLSANGLYKARIQYTVERDPATEEVSIHFEVDAGDRAHFDGVQMTGKFTASMESIIRATRWRRGFGPFHLPGWQPATENRVLNGIDRVRRDFQRRDRLQVSVILDRLEYHDKTNTVTPVLAIDAGPVIEIRTTGADVSRARLRQLIPVFQERTVDRSLLLEGNRNLVDYFQSQGYFDAHSDFMQKAEANGVQEIDFEITRNLRHKLVRIEVTGNRYFDTATIRERLTIREASFPRSRWGRYSQKLRDQDRDAIRDLYISNGFRSVQVNALTDDHYQGQADQLSVHFEIQEGPQSFVHSLEIEGASPDDEKFLRRQLQSTAGEPYSETNIAADRDRILSFYFNNGYVNASFDWEEKPQSAPRQIDLKYAVRPGMREFVREVLIRGLENTSPGLVSGKIHINPGDPVSQSQIAESQQKLYDLGIFSKVQTAIQNPDGIEDSKYVLFQLDEANKYSFNAGVGAELARIGGGVTTFDAPAGKTAFSPRISLGISRLNLLGLGHTVSLQTLASTIEQRAVASYIAPQFTGNENLSLTFSGLFDHTADVRTFTARRLEGGVQLAQRLSRANTFQYRFAFRRVDVSDLKISGELIPLLSQPVRVGLVSTAFVQDRRDDPADSHRGIYNTVDVGVALPALASQTEFTRILLRNSTYHPIGRDLVIARTLQFGYIQRLGGLAEIPLAERFFAGGASSQRAFPDNQAGPRDLETGFPLGGNALLFHQTELRFPLFGDNVGGVLFHDMGNVYSSIDDISFRFRQRNTQDFNYMVQSIGFGIRYRTPVGPIRIDFSLSPNSPRFVGFSGTLQQLLNCNPNLPASQLPAYCQGVPQRISIFQFHFSLGQTF